MSALDEEFLTRLHQNLEIRDLDPVDERYVDLDRYPGAVGPDAVRYLCRAISRTNVGSVYFLSGLRGSGKTTQLRRLRRELERRGFAAVRLDAEEYLNLRQPIDIVEFLFFLVGAISDEVEHAGWLNGHPSGRTWTRLQRWLAQLPRRISVEPSASAGTGLDLAGLAEAKVDLKAEIRRDESFVAQLRQFLDGRLSELTSEAHRVVRELVDDLRRAWSDRGHGEWLGLVVLVDSLDHVRGADFPTIRRALVDLFDKQADSIAIRDCRTVYIVPPYLHIDYATVRHLTNVKARDRDRRTVDEGVAALREVIERRFPDRDVMRLFPDEPALRRVLLASGGNLRDLLRLVMEVEVQAETLPVEATVVESAVHQVRNGLLPLAGDEREQLAAVARTHRAPLKSQDAWSELAQLFDRHLILGYANGETWFDVHPLVAELVEPPDDDRD